MTTNCLRSCITEVVLAKTWLKPTRGSGASWWRALSGVLRRRRTLSVEVPTNQAGTIDRARAGHATIRTTAVGSNRIDFDQDERLLPTAPYLLSLIHISE